jgi:hypothetical protein
VEEFAKRFEAGFHSQQELVALYPAEQGQTPGAEAARQAAQRRARLVERPQAHQRAQGHCW